MITKTMDFEYCNTCIKMVNKVDGVCLQCKTMDGEEYIKKSDVLRIIEHPISILHFTPREFYNAKADIESLPTINLSVIDEMIEEHTRLANENPKFFDHNSGYVIGLKELKQRLSIKQ